MSFGGFQPSAFQSDFQTSAFPVGLYVTDPEFVDGEMRDFRTFRFPVVGPTEEHVLTFDYSNELLGTEQLAGSPVVVVEVTAGLDPNPSAIITGVPALSSTFTQAQFPTLGGRDGCDYYFTVTVPTTNPFKVLARYAILQVRN